MLVENYLESLTSRWRECCLTPSPEEGEIDRRACAFWMEGSLCSLGISVSPVSLKTVLIMTITAATDTEHSLGPSTALDTSHLCGIIGFTPQSLEIGTIFSSA